ncbi:MULTISPECIES: hypothetical protein [Aquimarina]|nr:MULTISPECIES: hypothetical protein [Aquimarina]
MKTIQIVTVITFLFFSNFLFSCDCEPPRLINRFIFSDFVASAKILKVTKDNKSNDYHNIEVEILDLYKGKNTTSLRIFSALGSSCSFLTPENSTWLIFADYNKKGQLVFNYCSGAQQIDQRFNKEMFPNAHENHKRSIELQTQVLHYLKNQKLNLKNEYNLKVGVSSECLKQFRGVQIKNDRFALYEVTINKDLSIEKVHSIKNFDNLEIQEQLMKCLEDNVKVYNYRSILKIPKKTKIILPLYFYPPEKSHPGFISNFDL